MTVQNPLSPKVIAAAAGAGAGATLGTLLLWIIGAAAFGGGWSADQAMTAVASVPGPLAAGVLLAVTIAGAALPGYSVADPNRVSTDDAAMVTQGNRPPLPPVDEVSMSRSVDLGLNSPPPWEGEDVD